MGTDLAHAPSSLIAHPDQLAETLGVAGLFALPFAVPEIGAAFGLGGAADVGAGLGAADAAFGAFDPALFAADAADVAAGGLGTDLTALDAASAFADPFAFSANASSPFSSFSGDAIPFSDATSLVGPDAPTFASTDAELLGGQTGVPSVAAPTGTVPTGAGASSADVFSQLSTGPGIGADVTADPAVAAYTNPATLTDKLSGVLASPWTKLALAGAPLALTLAMGQGGLPSAAQQLQGQASALSQAGLTDLAAARAGQLNAGQTAVLGQMNRDLTNQWRQTLFNQGVQDPSKDARWPQIVAEIDSKVTQQTAVMIQQNITNALAETGQASAALTSIANLQLQQDQAFTNSLINATKSLGTLAGLNSGTTIRIG